MLLVLFAFGLSILLEIGLALSVVWKLPLKFRQGFAAVVIVFVAFVSGGIIAWRPNEASSLLLLLGAYRVFNLLRIAAGRINEAKLRRASRLTTIWLIGLQLVVGVAWFGFDRLDIGMRTWLYGLLAVQFLVGCMLLASSLRRVARTRPDKSVAHFSDKELPAITVAIPARNEDKQLEDCLRSILASDYPKLEILVLDDCSQDRTAEIIRGFAHDGVRFLPGEDPRPNWLAKNQAYERLASEASGDLILFVGVDVRFAPHSIRELVTTLLTRSKTTLSVMPVNEEPGLSLVQPMRYFWELAPPRRLFNRPPVLSSCWLITAKQLALAGGFAAVARSITPEAHFAKAAIAHDGYRFMRSDAVLGITSVKSRAEQRATAIRTRYPQLHRRPELVYVVSVTELGLLFAPFVLALLGVSGIFGWLAEGIAIITSLILLLTCCSSTSASFPRTRTRIMSLFPLALLIDVGLLHYSMWKYEFSDVTWKGRNVCIPVMHTIPHLPHLP